MNQQTQDRPAVEPAQRTGRLSDLLRAETHRFRSRRFIRWLLALAVLGYLVVTPLVAVTQFSRPSEELRSQARAEIARLVADQNIFREQCLKTPVPPDAGEGVTAEEFCGPPGRVEDYELEGFLPKRPFDLVDQFQPGSIGVGVAVAVLFFVIGATWIGAEWSSRTMMASLFWEPRRLRVLAVKTAVLVAVCAVSAVVAQLIWAGSAWVIASTRGSVTGLPTTFWTDAAALGGRATLLAVLVGLLGMAVAHLIRSTGAALGVGFVYFAIVENMVTAFLPRVQPWTLSSNAAALMAPGGLSLSLPGQSVDPRTGAVLDQTEVVLSNLHGGLVLGAAVVVLLGLGGWLFRRRDLT